MIWSQTIFFFIYPQSRTWIGGFSGFTGFSWIPTLLTNYKCLYKPFANKSFHIYLSKWGPMSKLLILLINVIMITITIIKIHKNTWPEWHARADSSLFSSRIVCIWWSLDMWVETESRRNKTVLRCICPSFPNMPSS